MGKHWIIDGHCDSLGQLTDGKRNLRENEPHGHWDLIRAKQGGIVLQFFAAYIESEYKPFLAIHRGLQQIAALHQFIDENTEDVFLVTKKPDLELLGKTEKIGILLNIEGGEILGESLFMLDIVHRLGVRSIGLTWNERNAIADGVGEITSKGGLSQFGLKVISKMNQLGIMIDVSHLNEAGFWDVVGHTAKPIIASHSCAKSLCNHRRNLNDEQLRAIAENKGVVGINFCPEFLCDNRQAVIDDVVDHIVYIAEIAGIETIGFGSDFDGIESTPIGLESAAQFPQIIAKLAQRGFTENEIRQICQGNFERVLQNVLE